MRDSRHQVDRARKKPRLGLRPKLMIVCLLSAFSPVFLVWVIGTSEDVRFEGTEKRIDKAAQLLELREEIGTQTPEEIARGGWLDDFGKEHNVMLRVLDANGDTVFATDSIDGDQGYGTREWAWRTAAVLFEFPTPPSLLRFEERLVSPAERTEVREALSGKISGLWRKDEELLMYVYYRALPLPQGGALYLTKAEFRGVGALWDMRYVLLRLTMFISIFVALFGLIVGWRLITPLIALQKGIGAYLASPRKEVAREIVISRSDELGVLSMDVGELVSKLHSRFSQMAETAGDFAHDLKNPIATVSTSAELLATGKPLEQKRLERIAAALDKATSHMRRSVAGMLQLARLEESLAEDERRAVDLASLIREIISDRKVDDEASGPEITFQTQGNVPLIWGSPPRFIQLFGCLLDNAIAFAHEKVLVEFTSQGGVVQIDVCDDGPGVSEGNRGKIFRRFFTSRPGDMQPGNGLGLAIASVIARSHGGDVHLENSCPLSGACFRVIFPTRQQ